MLGIQMYVSAEVPKTSSTLVDNLFPWATILFWYRYLDTNGVVLLCSEGGMAGGWG